MTKNIFSNESLQAWLETQDPNGEYDYSRNKGCILYRYFKEVMPEIIGVTSEVVVTADKRELLPPHWNAIAKREPWTVEAVLDRLVAEIIIEEFLGAS